MALIKCPECGKEISDKSQVCINCGYPISIGIENISELLNHSIIRKKEKSRTYITISIISFALSFIMWYWKVSHGVKIAEARVNYAALRYVDDILIMSRIVNVALPITVIIFLIFLTLSIIMSNKRI